MNRLGTVLVFKSGVPRERIAEAIKSIADVIGPDYHLSPAKLAEYGSRAANAVTREDAVTGEPLTLVNEFNERDGGPVWYIP